MNGIASVIRHSLRGARSVVLWLLSLICPIWLDSPLHVIKGGEKGWRSRQGRHRCTAGRGMQVLRFQTRKCFSEPWQILWPSTKLTAPTLGMKYNRAQFNVHSICHHLLAPPRSLFRSAFCSKSRTPTWCGSTSFTRTKKSTRSLLKWWKGNTN